MLFGVSCKKDPNACIEVGETSVSTGVPVSFTSCSENALSYEWYIEGPSGAPENSMGWSDEGFSNTFTITGTYIITLHAYEDFSFDGQVSTAESSIVIN